MRKKTCKKINNHLWKFGTLGVAIIAGIGALILIVSGKSLDSRSDASTGAMGMVAGLRHLDGSAECASAKSATVTINNAAGQSGSPFRFSNIIQGTYTFTVTAPPGCDVSYTVCFNDINCHNTATRVNSNQYTVTINGGYYDLWWYFKKSNLTVPSTEEKKLDFKAIGENASQYSPFVMSMPGWGTKLMYTCKNTNEGGVMRDRVWRYEQWPSGWDSGRISVAGQLNSPTDLSCSPGVVIGPDGKWHMYYVTADRNSGMTLYLYHSTSTDIGVTWKTIGQVQFPGIIQPIKGYVETPVALYKDGKFILYYNTGEGITRAESNDGHNFSTPVVVTPLKGSQAGRVSLINNKYYFVYSKHTTDLYGAPNEIWIMHSKVGKSFTDPQKLVTANGQGWDATQIWSPHLIYDHINKHVSLYYAGNNGKYGWWGSNSAIGHIKINLNNY